MTIEKALITPAQADATLASESDWKDLATPEKTNHIAFASTYVQLNWYCTGIDWSDETTIPDEVKEAVAYYALANSRGTLFEDTNPQTERSGDVQEKTSQLGGLKSTVKYFESSESEEGYPLQYPDALMDFYCNKVSGGAGSVKAVRF